MSNGLSSSIRKSNDKQPAILFCQIYKKEKNNNIKTIAVGAFHYAKDSGNFGRTSNGKIHLGFF